MTSPVLSLSFIVVALAAVCFTFPINEPPTPSSIPLNVVEGRLPQGFTTPEQLITSTFNTPLFDETTAGPRRLSKKEEGAENGGGEIPLEETTVRDEGESGGDLEKRGLGNFEEKNDPDVTPISKGKHRGVARVEQMLDLTTVSDEEQSGSASVERGARTIDDSSTLTSEVVSKENVVVAVKTSVEKVTDSPLSKPEEMTTSTLTSSSSSSSSTKSSEKYVGHYEEGEEEEEKKEKESTTKKPRKNKKESEEEEKHESKESEEEMSTPHSSGQVAEYAPDALDSISTPPGSRLNYDENHQSIPRLTTEKTKEGEETDGVPSADRETVTVTLIEHAYTSKPIFDKFGKARPSGSQLNQGEKSANTEEEEPDH